MISHGITTGALFLLVGIIYDQTGDRQIPHMGGLGARLPHYAAIFGLFTFASIGLPGLSGFIGEFLVILGAFRYNGFVAAVTMLVVIASAVYMLWMFQRVFFTVDLFLPRANKWILTPLTVAGLVLAGAACIVVWDINETVYAGFYVVDDVSVFLKATTIVIGILSTLFAPAYLKVRRIPLGEFNTILVSALIGMCVLASSSDLITLFLGLELMTMPSYLLTGLHKTDRYSNEGGLKYFLLGSFASAILLFGAAWIYGLTGTTNIAAVAAALDGQMSAGMLVAIGFLTVGATFKIAAVPFHYWTPDAYQGAPTPITGFLSVGPKLGAFALLIRVFAEALDPLRADWLGIFLVLTVLTMTIGNIVALIQVNVKRMLAYSSIAHTGYIMAGMAAYANAPTPEAASQGIESILFYVFGYALMNIAAFAVVAMLQRDTSRFGGLGSFAGLASRAPGRAAAMAILMLSLTGIPPTIGFLAKLFVLLAA